ncbi:MAG TPA: PrgI family protein [Candidatus Limnocylindrales bacterium]|nr:PrgI family protein [Candidatus Limnocylindrales bacterium]
MATYKVIQDVEAEDTLIGPLSLRQCIYAAIAALAGYALFVSIAKGAAFMAVIFLPIIAFGVFFAYPWSKQQPTEVWALAKVRFFLKPRRRIWNQSGAQELVTITAPKKVERVLTNGLSQSEVKSRLKALADTIDTRGWAVKNVGVNIYNQPNNGPYDSTDRLVTAATLPQDVPNYDTTAVVDMLDAQANPRVQQLDQMMNASAVAQRERIVQQIEQPEGQAGQGPAANSSQNGSQPAPDYWFLQTAPAATDQPLTGPVVPGFSTAPPTPIAATPTAAEEALIHNLKAQGPQIPMSSAHLRTIQPLSAQTQMPTPPAAPPTTPVQTSLPEMSLPPVTTGYKPATLELANNNYLTVAAMAHEAERLNSAPTDEVIVPLHQGGWSRRDI